MNEISILIGGKAGDGVKQAGNTISRLLNRLGYKIFFYDDYPSLIRGGHNFSIIRASKDKILCHEETVDVIVALNQDTIDKNKERLNQGGIIVLDSNQADADGVGVPFSDIVKRYKGIPIMRNVAALGALTKVLGIPWENFEEIIKSTVRNGIETNLLIARASFDSIKREYMKIESTGEAPCPILTGNEALALGAVRGGLEIYVAYPMTPASSILHFLAQHGPKLGVTTIHPESEIGAALMTLGSAYAGNRAMTGSSGGGFALMTEAVSLAGQSEIPIVFVECQRAGPSTGVPTYTPCRQISFLYFMPDMESSHGLSLLLEMLKRHLSGHVMP